MYSSVEDEQSSTAKGRQGGREDEKTGTDGRALEDHGSRVKEGQRKVWVGRHGKGPDSRDDQPQH